MHVSRAGDWQFFKDFSCIMICLSRWGAQQRAQQRARQRAHSGTTAGTTAGAMMGLMAGLMMGSSLSGIRSSLTAPRTVSMVFNLSTLVPTLFERVDDIFERGIGMVFGVLQGML